MIADGELWQQTLDLTQSSFCFMDIRTSQGQIQEFCIGRGGKHKKHVMEYPPLNLRLFLVWYMTHHRPLMYPHTKFDDATWNNVEEMPLKQF